MKKFLLLFVIGLACGYWLGFKDARTHKENIIARMVDRVGGSNRENYKNDIDKRLERLEQ
jgi:hypothetical protein